MIKSGEMVYLIAAKSGISMNEACKVIDCLFTDIVTGLKAGEEIVIPEFGVFSVVDGKAVFAADDKLNERIND